MPQNLTWLVGGHLILPDGVRRGAVAIAGGRIRAIRATPGRGGTRLNVRDGLIGPGFVDLHVWGPSAILSRELVKQGTTSFLASLGPSEPERLLSELETIASTRQRVVGARCLGAHLEGPFVNPVRGGALPRRWMRPAHPRELRQLARYRDHIRMMTLAPELPGAIEAIRWCRRHGIVASLGHTDADARCAANAAATGATAVTHLFNGMRSFHHREPALLGWALTDPRLRAMLIPDGVHTDPLAFRLAAASKGRDGVVLVTDSIQRQSAPQYGLKRHEAFYTAEGALAGSALRMNRAVRNAQAFGKLSLSDAVGMASANPARLIGRTDLGRLAPGARADLVVLDDRLGVRMTIVNGHIVYQRGS